MLKLILWMIVVFTLCSGYSQNPSIQINGRDLNNNMTCFEYPNSIGYSFSNPAIKVSKGRYSLVRGHRIIQVVMIDSVFHSDSLKPLIVSLQPNDALFIDVYEMSLNSRKLACNNFRSIQFSPDLNPVVDSSFDLIINNSVLYKKSGIVVDSVFSIQIVSTIELNDVKTTVTQARGNRSVRVTVLNQNQLNIEMFKQGVPGDRFILEMRAESTNRTKIVVVPITD